MQRKIFSDSGELNGLDADRQSARHELSPSKFFEAH